MIEASWRHYWSLYRKASQQVGNTHCTSLVSGTRMKHTYFCTVSSLCFLSAPAPVAITTHWTSAPEALLLPHLPSCTSCHPSLYPPAYSTALTPPSGFKYCSSFPRSCLLQIDTITIIFYLSLSPPHMLPNCLPSFFHPPSRDSIFLVVNFFEFGSL